MPHAPLYPGLSSLCVCVVQKTKAHILVYLLAFLFCNLRFILRDIPKPLDGLLEWIDLYSTILCGLLPEPRDTGRVPLIPGKRLKGLGGGICLDSALSLVGLYSEILRGFEMGDMVCGGVGALMDLNRSVNSVRWRTGVTAVFVVLPAWYCGNSMETNSL